MDEAVSDMLKKFEEHIKKELKYLLIDAEKSKFAHNHPPLGFLINTCPYCQKYGNVFNNNIQEIVEEEDELLEEALSNVN